MMPVMHEDEGGKHGDSNGITNVADYAVLPTPEEGPDFWVEDEAIEDMFKGKSDTQMAL